jgi:drug/metabolite transporter (DMT)-like permease
MRESEEMLNARAQVSLNAISIFVAAGLAISLFALTPVTARLSVVQFDATDVGLMRIVVAGLIAVPVLIIFRLKPPQLWRDRLWLMFSAFGTFAAFPILFVIGIQRTSAAHASLIMAAMPLFTVAIAAGLDRRMPMRLWLAGAVVAVVGETALVMFREYGAQTQQSCTGDLLVLCACILCASGSATGARVARHMNVWAVTFWGIALAGVAFSPIAFLRLFAIQWIGILPLTWIALTHFTIGAGLFAFVAWFWSLAKGGINRIAVLQFAQPILGVLFAWGFLREHLTPMVLVTGLVIVTGILLAWRGSVQSHTATTKDLAKPELLNSTYEDRIGVGALDTRGSLPAVP